PSDRKNCEVRVGGKVVRLTNLQKVYWPESGITKGDLLRYYLEISPWRLPHLKDRAMVMKRFPNGIRGKHFFMKRAPAGRPSWIQTCSIKHGSGSVIDFPLIQNLPSLLWVVNLGCIDLNPWYSRCSDVDRPDFLHFDLDPVPGASFSTVREAALIVRDALARRDITCYAKTSGSKGIHVYVPLRFGPAQKEVWTYAKEFAKRLESEHGEVVTAEYRKAKRPRGTVLVDYNQNAWGQTLASVYSVRPREGATVSAPVTWEEISDGCEIGDFTIGNVPGRLREVGDLWRKLLWKRGRVLLE
ncbi:MAG TPA: non-homologous end-joining DNA ligase, partial [Longimicrobiaceae bacterium]|nr:non-homologous end-joining DNA ligase [Longimicrobiaceae bacterium]